jgi:hypothetical protein
VVFAVPAFSCRGISKPLRVKGFFSDEPALPNSPPAGQKVGIKQVDDKIWLVSFMSYDLGYFDHQACRLEPIDNPFKAKVLPMSPV